MWILFIHIQTGSQCILVDPPIRDRFAMQPREINHTGRLGTAGADLDSGSVSPVDGGFDMLGSRWQLVGRGRSVCPRLAGGESICIWTQAHVFSRLCAGRWWRWSGFLVQRLLLGVIGWCETLLP
jgi:hypothetical protein